VGLDLL